MLFLGVLQWDCFAWAGKCPKCPRVAQTWLLLTWATQGPRDSELWPQLALLQQQPVGDWDFLSFVLTWDVAVLHQTHGKYRIKNNTRILGLWWVFLDILEYIVCIKNIPRRRAAGLPACCTSQSMYLISGGFLKCFKLFTNSPLVGGKRRETPRHKELAVWEA